MCYVVCIMPLVTALQSYLIEKSFSERFLKDLVLNQIISICILKNGLYFQTKRTNTYMYPKVQNTNFTYTKKNNQGQAE